MFRSELLSLEMLAALGIPLVLTLAITALIGAYWKSARARQELSYPASTFREPINAGLSVAAFTVPLLSALLGYLALQGVTAARLVPLYASTMLVALSVGVGLWNIFSTMTVKNDAITINGTAMWLFPAQVVAQFLLIAFGGLMLVAYLTLFFRVPAAEPSIPDPGAPVHYLARPSLHLQLSKSDVLAIWGRPRSRESRADTERLRYRTDTSEIVLEFRGETMLSIQETRKEQP